MEEHLDEHDQPTELFCCGYGADALRVQLQRRLQLTHLRKLLFATSSLTDISHLLTDVDTPNLEELIFIHTSTKPWRGKESSWVQPPRYMILPHLQTLKIAGYLPEVCLLFDILEVPRLSLLELTLYGFTGRRADRAYLGMVDDFIGRCPSLEHKKFWVVIPEQSPQPPSFTTTLLFMRREHIPDWLLGQLEYI